MTMPAEFQSGTDWEQSSGPLCIRDVHESDCWPVDDNSNAANKDHLDEGLHPVIAVGPRVNGLGRPILVTGVVTSFTHGLTQPLDVVRVNIADGMIVRQWVSNILTYSNGTPNAWVTVPAVGTPVYVDDSADLSAGVTLSMSPLNETGYKNPQAGVLWYCQNEMADEFAGGPRHAATFDISLPGSTTEQEFCVLLFNGSREL